MGDHIWHKVGIISEDLHTAKVSEEGEVYVRLTVPVVVQGPLNVTEPLDVTVSGPNPLPVAVADGVTIVGPVTLAGPLSIDTGTPLNVSITNATLAITEPVTVDGTVAISGTVPVSISGQPITVSGTVAATQSGSWTVTSSGVFAVTPASIAPVTSLNAVSSTGAGAVLDAGQVVSGCTMHVATTGTPSAFDVEIQVSTDNVTWFNTGAAITVSGTSARAEAHGRYYRANLTSLTGGSSPTITAILATAF